MWLILVHWNFAPCPLYGHLDGSSSAGETSFCLVKDNKHSVYENAVFLVFYPKLARKWKGEGSLLPLGVRWRYFETQKSSNYIINNIYFFKKLKSCYILVLRS